MGIIFTTAIGPEKTAVIIYDPTGFLGDYGFSVKGQVYASSNLLHNLSGPKIAILDYLGDIEPQRCSFDLIIWFTLENFYALKSRIQDHKKEIMLGPNSTGADFFLCNWIYSTAFVYKKTYVKPNLNCRYIATMLVGRLGNFRKINRAWAYYEILERGWQDHVIMTVRDQIGAEVLLDEVSRWPDIKTDMAKKIKIFGGIETENLPNFDHLECNSIKQSLDKRIPINEIFDGDKHNHVFLKNNLIPTNFYRHSFCDIVLQEFRNPGAFIDEKIAKPLCMGRPFVVIGPQYYLQFLRELGFRTFDPVIDESYDREPDPVKRWSLAFDQIQILKNSNLQSVNDRLKNRLKHNRKMSYNSEYWVNRLKEYLNYIIENHTGQSCVIY